MLIYDIDQNHEIIKEPYYMNFLFQILFIEKINTLNFRTVLFIHLTLFPWKLANFDQNEHPIKPHFTSSSNFIELKKILKKIISLSSQNLLNCRNGIYIFSISFPNYLSLAFWKRKDNIIIAETNQQSIIIITRTNIISFNQWTRCSYTHKQYWRF